MRDPLRLVSIRIAVMRYGRSVALPRVDSIVRWGSVPGSNCSCLRVSFHCVATGHVWWLAMAHHASALSSALSP